MSKAMGCISKQDYIIKLFSDIKASQQYFCELLDPTLFIHHLLQPKRKTYFMWLCKSLMLCE